MPPPLNNRSLSYLKTRAKQLKIYDYKKKPKEVLIFEIRAKNQKNKEGWFDISNKCENIFHR